MNRTKVFPVAAAIAMLTAMVLSTPGAAESAGDIDARCKLVADMMASRVLELRAGMPISQVYPKGDDSAGDGHKGVDFVAGYLTSHPDWTPLEAAHDYYKACSQDYQYGGTYQVTWPHAPTASPDAVTVGILKVAILGKTEAEVVAFLGQPRVLARGGGGDRYDYSSIAGFKGPTVIDSANGLILSEVIVWFTPGGHASDVTAGNLQAQDSTALSQPAAQASQPSQNEGGVAQISQAPLTPAAAATTPRMPPGAVTVDQLQKAIVGMTEDRLVAYLGQPVSVSSIPCDEAGCVSAFDYSPIDGFKGLTVANKATGEIFNSVYIDFFADAVAGTPSRVVGVTATSQ